MLSATEIEYHQQAIARIIHAHLAHTKHNIDPVYRRHFGSLKAVSQRHWKHRADIPNDLAALPRISYHTVKSWFRAEKNLSHNPGSRKQAELEQIVLNELLEIPLLESKIKTYLAPVQSRFDDELLELTRDIPILEKEQLADHIAQHMQKLSLPTEGARDALIFLVTGLLGRALGQKVSFGSTLATGQAIATALYMKNLPWYGALWVSMTGIPGWVGVAGMTAGALSALMIAPLIAPVLETGINRFRARRLLARIVENAHDELINPGKDGLDLAGFAGVYLQTLADIIHLSQQAIKHLKSS